MAGVATRDVGVHGPPHITPYNSPCFSPLPLLTSSNLLCVITDLDWPVIMRDLVRPYPSRNEIVPPPSPQLPTLVWRTDTYHQKLQESTTPSDDSWRVTAGAEVKGTREEAPSVWHRSLSTSAIVSAPHLCRSTTAQPYYSTSTCVALYSSAHYSGYL